MQGKRITTIEGLSKPARTAQKAWIEHEVPQCGYCQTGMMMSVAALLAKKPHPRRRHRRGHDELPPLRHVCPGAQGHSPRANLRSRAGRRRGDHARRRQEKPEESRHDDRSAGRRTFLKASAALGGGLALEFTFPAAAASGAPPTEVNAWVVIHRTTAS